MAQMSQPSLGKVLRGIRQAAQGAEPPPDAELLRRLVASRDGPAFEALVRRHGPMVLGPAAGCSGTPRTRKTPPRPRSSCWPAGLLLLCAVGAAALGHGLAAPA